MVLDKAADIVERDLGKVKKNTVSISKEDAKRVADKQVKDMQEWLK